MLEKSFTYRFLLPGSEACTWLFSNWLRLENTTKNFLGTALMLGQNFKIVKGKLSLIWDLFVTGTPNLAVINNLLVQFYSLYRSFWEIWKSLILQSVGLIMRKYCSSFPSRHTQNWMNWRWSSYKSNDSIDRHFNT